MGRPPNKDEQVWVRIPAKIKKRAIKLAEDDGRSLSNWIRQLIEREVAKK